jgi:acetylornithine/succinyldiaminopimelate/putrescine aminotransferase
MKFVGQSPKQTIIDLFAAHVNSGKAAFFKQMGMDFVFGKREGIYVWDVAGEKRIINCHCNGGVYNLGHRNPEIIKTMTAAMSELDIGNGHLISEARAMLGKRLAELAPGPELTRTCFASGGGEAADFAIKLARGYTKRPRVVSARGGYHGHTGLALAAGDEKYRAPFGPMPPGFSQVPFGDSEALEKEIDDQTAAVIVETVPATLGMPIPDDDYFPQVRDICTKKDVVLIMDEVQTGLGRTGRLWGIEHFGVEPDIMIIAKGLSGGIFPIAATMFREKYEQFFLDTDPFIHVSTYGGAEVGCPVALKVLDISSEPAFLQNVRDTAVVFEKGFVGLKRKHPEILVGLRQLGLMMGIEMVNEYCGPAMSLTCYNNGILSVYANNDKRVSQLLPPLITTQKEAEEILDRLDAALGDAKKMLGLAQ